MSQAAPSTEVEAGAAPAGRDRSIDVAKGIPIVAIVAGHVWRGLAASGAVDGRSNLFQEIHTALYAVHLPMFVLVAGVFVQRGVAKYGAHTYLWRRAVDFTWLSRVWTQTQGCAKLGTNRLVDTPTTPGQLLESLWRPDTQLWFFPFFADPDRGGRAPEPVGNAHEVHPRHRSGRRSQSRGVGIDVRDHRGRRTRIDRLLRGRRPVSG